MVSNYERERDKGTSEPRIQKSGKDSSRLLTHLRESREESDYGYIIETSQENAKRRILDAKKIIEEVKHYLEKRNYL